MDTKQARAAKAKAEQALAKIAPGLTVKDEATRAALLKMSVQFLGLTELLCGIDDRMKDLRASITHHVSDLVKRVNALEAEDNPQALAARLANVEFKLGALSMSMGRNGPDAAKAIESTEDLLRQVKRLETRIKKLERAK